MSQVTLLSLAPRRPSWMALGPAGLAATFPALRWVPLAPSRLRELVRLADPPVSPLILLWAPLPMGPRLLEAVLRLRALLPEGTLGLVGPGVGDRVSAEQLLRHLPELDLALFGEPEVACAAALEPLASRQDPRDFRTWLSHLREPPAGLAVRQSEAVCIGPDPVPGAAELLGSPLLAGLLKPDARVWHHGLEVARGALPFSPLELHLQPGPWRGLPVERLREELRLLCQAPVPALELLGGPLDLLPGLLEEILELLAESNRATAVRLSLSAPPRDALLGRLLRAGVSSIRIRQPSLERDDRRSAGPLDRGAIRQTLQSGLEVAVECVAGRPEDTTGDLHALLDAYALIPGLTIQLSILQLWPGHPLRREWQGSARSPLEAPGSRPACVSGGTWEVLGTPGMPPSDLAALHAERQALQELGDRLPMTLRLLAQALQLPFAALLRAFGGWLLDHPVSARAPVTPEFLRARALRFMLPALKEVGQPDLIPLMRQCLRYELWLTARRHPIAPQAGVPVNLDELSLYVLDLAPGVELRSFPYPLPALFAKGRLDEIPLHRTDVLLRRRGMTAPLVQVVSPPLARLLEQIDGIHPVQVLEEQRRSPHTSDRQRTNAVEEGFDGLLERGLVIAVRHLAEPTDPEQPHSNVLLFRPLQPVPPDPDAEPES